jgi:hypothetical protein
MRLLITGGDTFDLNLVPSTIESVLRARHATPARVVVEDLRTTVALAASDWASENGVALVENTDFMAEKPDAAIIFPGCGHRPFRLLMAAKVPIYRVSPEGRYIKYEAK